VIDVDRETAHEAAARELAKPIYPRTSLSERIAAWLNDLLNRVVDSGSALPGGWLTIVVLALLALALLVTAVRIAARAMGGRGENHLYGGRVLAAAGHRSHAEQLAARGNSRRTACSAPSPDAPPANWRARPVRFCPSSSMNSTRQQRLSMT
jgi:hypothetical protein